MKVRDDMLNEMCKMSDRAVDQKLKDRLKSLIGRQDVKDEVLGIIDDAVFYSWTSNLVISCLHQIWIDCGGSEEELKARNRSLTYDEENRKKYKWEPR